MDEERPARNPDASSHAASEIQSNDEESRELDWARTLSHTGEREDMARQLASVYLLESQQLIQQMSKSLAVGDAVALARACHSLKGATGYFGAEGVVQLSKSLEAQAKSGDLTSAAETFELLAEAVQRLTTLLSQKVSG